MNTDSSELNAGNTIQPTHSPFLPVLFVTIALASWLGFQTYQLARESTSLDTAVKSQEQLVQNSLKMRKSLETIASETQKLAEQGNTNAKLLVDELKKRGVSINTNAAGPAPAQSTP